MAVRLRLGRRSGEDRVASCFTPQPSPHRAVHQRVRRGRSVASPRGDERASRAPRGYNALLLTAQSRSRRLDAVAVRLSLGHSAREERIASCPAQKPSPHRAVHACMLRGRSADAPRGNERAGRAPGKSNAVTPTVRSRSRRLDAPAVHSSNGQRTGENRVMSFPATQHSPHRAVHARVFCGRSAGSPHGDERAGRAPWELDAVTSMVRSRSRRLDAVVVRPSHGHGAGKERVASCPAPLPSPYHAVHALVLRGRSADAPRGDERAGRASRESNAVSPGV